MMVLLESKVLLELQDALVLTGLQVFWDLKAVQVQLELQAQLVWGRQAIKGSQEPLALWAAQDQLALQELMEISALRGTQALPDPQVNEAMLEVWELVEPQEIKEPQDSLVLLVLPELEHPELAVPLEPQALPELQDQGLRVLVPREQLDQQDLQVLEAQGQLVKLALLATLVLQVLLVDQLVILELQAAQALLGLRDILELLEPGAFKELQD
jgi:hypothetical protein